MGKNVHVLIIFCCLAFVLVLGTLTFQGFWDIKFLFVKDNAIPILVYTMLFMAVAYTGYWIYTRDKNI
tara:strand:+ start:2219 stop:2422 length:204 start_codon:yes stop_codon:yes gene_type:complete